MVPATAQALGEPADGQYRIGPHTDFGTITLLDRQPGVSGLQVLSADGAWLDAPYLPGSLTINVGDLIARWSGGRWRSNLHRILAPSPDAPAEELISLVLFMETNVGAVVAPLPPPVGGGATARRSTRSSGSPRRSRRHHRSARGLRPRAPRLDGQGA